MAKTAFQARHAVGWALRSGALVRPSNCEVCGAPDQKMKDGRSSIQAHHHRGYDKPLDVQWLCVACHRRETPIAFGERAGAAKVGWALVTSIRSRYAAGESYYRIADDLNFNRTTIHRVVTGRTWPEHARPQEASK